MVRPGGAGKPTAWIAVVGAIGATGLLAVSLFVVSFGECLSENGNQPPSWPWSPRRQFCNSGSHAALGGLALLLVPAALISAGALLGRGRSRPTAVWIAATLAVVIAIPLPRLYVSSLPLYRLDAYPILHDPILRPAGGGVPARVCYVYGIVFGPRKTPVADDSPRTCVELRSTPQALALTAAYDQGQTIYELEWVGKNLTARGLPVRPGGTGVEGLVVAKAYELPGTVAVRSSNHLDGAI